MHLQSHGICWPVHSSTVNVSPLQGPSKYLCEAALRGLASMLSTCESAFNCSSTQAASAHQPDNHLDAAAWLRAQDVSPLVIVLRHTSARVQLRAARLALLLAQSDVWCEVFVETPGALQAACRLACGSGGGSGNGSACGMVCQSVSLHKLSLKVT